MEEVQGSQVSINVRSFAGASVTLKVGKKEGMENVELLAGDTPVKTPPTDEATPLNGLWDTLSK